MNSKPFGPHKINIKSQPLTLTDALFDQLKNFRSNIQNVAMEVQSDDLSVIRAFLKAFSINIVLKHSDGAYQGIKLINSKVTLKVLEAGNEYFSVSRTEELEREKSRKRKWEKKSQALMTPERLSKRKESLKGYLKKHKEDKAEKVTDKKKGNIGNRAQKSFKLLLWELDCTSSFSI